MKSMFAAMSVVLPAVAFGAAPATGDLKSNCDKSCVVTVTVPAGCGSGIDVSPDPVVVGKGATAQIEWKIVGDWAFAENGIFVHQAGEAFQRGKSVKAGGPSFALKNVNRKPATYKYDVNLVGKDGAKCSRDPTVVNH